MRWISQASACLLAVALAAGCNGQRDNRNAGTAGSPNETGSMSDTTHMSDTSAMAPGAAGTNVTPSDTGMAADTGMKRDTSRSAAGAPSAKNQTESGTTNSSTGKSTLGPGVTKTRPDQGQPVTSKGDTVNPGVDSAR